ncbi:MFS transporter [Pseudomonas putida]|uniref:MFS transporter n=1 Tax=Pseudomonas putida TaxID=303 RepID=UPI00300F5307
MNTAASRLPNLRKNQQSTRIAFFIAGFVMAAWAPMVPYAKLRADLTDGALGLLLLCLGAGSLLAMPISGSMVAKRGCKPVIVGATLLATATFPLLAFLSAPALLAVALFCFGAGVGMVDCTMNTQAIIVEREGRKPLMSGFHGLFSLGGIVGAAFVSALLASGLDLLLTAGVVVAIVLVMLIWATPNLLTSAGDSKTVRFALPHGLIVLIGLVCFASFLAEGAMLDWSAVILVDTQHIASEHAGIGYAAFAVTMTIGRFTGDQLVTRLGPKTTVIYGFLLSALGVLLGVVSPHWAGSIAGFALVGLGCANIAPVMYTQIGRQKVMPESLAVPAVSMMGYAGILIGPAFIGFVAHLSSLIEAFALVASLQIVSVALALRIFKQQQHD